MNKKWECYNLDNEKVEELVKKRHITNLLASILVNRGIIDGDGNINNKNFNIITKNIFSYDTIIIVLNCAASLRTLSSSQVSPQSQLK